jgi:heparan-alpha-glucosaminide N-acetyltransferase
VMFLMMAEVLRLGRIAKALPDSPVWQFLGHHQSHVEWAGCSLHDLIQPSFSFLVGAALPFSLAARAARGQDTARMIAHAAWRALLLVLLGVFLRSVGKPRTNFTFEDTLSQIGLGYLPLFLLALGPPKGWWAALGAILVGYWAAFALYPLPGPDFDYAAAGVAPDWPHNYSGFAAHWNKNTNLAWAFDTWFLNLFPRDKPFLFNGGGYATLSFIPTLGTMILGLIAGDRLRRGDPGRAKVGWFVVTGAACLALGLAADEFGLCPSVKRIWTPSWVLVSGGWCFLILAGFYAVIDVLGRRAWSYPLRVIGRNSIAAYVMAHLFDDFVVKSFQTHLGRDVFKNVSAWMIQTRLRIGGGRLEPDELAALSAAYQPLVSGAAILLVYWLILWWMDRRKIYLRV